MFGCTNTNRDLASVLPANTEMLLRATHVRDLRDDSVDGGTDNKDG